MNVLKKHRDMENASAQVVTEPVAAAEETK